MKSQSLIKYAVMFLLSLIDQFCYAVQNQLPTMYVLHINGINTVPREARVNLDNLERNSQMSSTGKYLKWNVVYNPTADEKTTSSTIAAGVNLLDNIIDVGLQKNNELSLKNISKEQYVNAYIIANKLNKNMNKAEYKQLQSQLMPHYQALIKKYGGNNTDAAINEFHKKAPPQFLGVLQLLDEGNNGIQYDYSHTPSSVLLIPHSQGNLYANSLYKYLTGTENFNPKHIAIFGIASPAGSNFGDWPINDKDDSSFNQNDSYYMIKDSLSTPATSYVTSCSDIVINTLRTTDPSNQPLFQVLNYIWPHGVFEQSGILNCNMDPSSGVSADDMLHHNLIQYYLATPELKTQIITMMSYFAYQLNYYLLNDLVDNMTPRHPKFNTYPQTLTAVIGFTNYDLQSFTDNKGNIIWSKDYTNKQLLTLQTPVLDSIVEAGNTVFNFGNISDWDRQFKFYLIHFAALPNKNTTNHGFDPNSNFYIVEDINKINEEFYPFHIYPHDYLKYNSLNNQSDGCRYVQYTYDYGEPTFGQYFDGVYKYLRTWSPSLTELVKSCASSSPELLLKHKYLIDAQFQRQAL